MKRYVKKFEENLDKRILKSLEKDLSKLIYGKATDVINYGIFDLEKKYNIRDKMYNLMLKNKGVSHINFINKHMKNIMEDLLNLYENNL